MSKNTARPPHIAALQRVIAEPITDPVEQAAIDRMRERIKRRRTKTNAAANSRRR
jgi:hypothetical protein